MIIKILICVLYLYSISAFSQQFQYYKKGNKFEYIIGEQPVVAPDGSFMIFVSEDTNIATKNDIYPKGKPFKTFYQAFRINDTLWTQPTELSLFTEYDTINDKYRSTSVGTPFITSENCLFFSRYYMTTFIGVPQKDILYSFYRDFIFSLPISIDSINTGLEEISPVLLRDTLYFLHRDIDNVFLGRSCREKNIWYTASYIDLPNFIRKPHLQVINGKPILIYEHHKTKKIYLAEIIIKDTTINLIVDLLLTSKNKFKNSLISISKNHIYGSIMVKRNKKNISIISSINLSSNGKMGLLNYPIFQSIFFDKQQFLLNNVNTEDLKKIAAFMKTNSKIRMQIIGYADSDNLAAYNLKLSEQRANIVKTYLVNLGINTNRLVTIGYGEKHQKTSNNNEQNKAQNRRVEFKIIE